jgi:GTP-binding protein
MAEEENASPSRRLYGAGGQSATSNAQSAKGRIRPGERSTPNDEKLANTAIEGEIEKPVLSEAERSRTDRESKTENASLADLTRAGQEFLLARGGAGGKGNVHFKSSRNRAPRQYTEGEEGEQGHFLLELRTIADAGLVGYPNAGKSTLLRRISAARPKVASYPFTTLHPIVGVVDFPGYRRATIADIPGLIEGAHRNVGLGHDFLRHITRCQLLLFVLDVAGSEGRTPIEDLQNLRREIDLYDQRLSQRPWFVVANKMDLPGAAENLAALRKRFSSIEIVPVSAIKGGGIEALKKTLEKTLAHSPMVMTRSE